MTENPRLGLSNVNSFHSLFFRVFPYEVTKGNKTVILGNTLVKGGKFLKKLCVASVVGITR